VPQPWLLYLAAGETAVANIPTSNCTFWHNTPFYLSSRVLIPLDRMACFTDHPATRARKWYFVFEANTTHNYGDEIQNEDPTN
jgi:hypothetical protein